MPPTRMLGDDQDSVVAAVEILSRGGLVAFPTETVYGLGADARDDRAVAGIFAAKERPSFNPLIVHVPSLDEAQQYAEFSDPMRALARTLWPGPLSLVLPVREARLSELVTAGLTTVAIRVPAHPLAQRLLSAFGGPIAAPSANPSGRISPTTASHVRDGLEGRVDVVIDGGACAVGLESTILGESEAGPVLLRPGGLPVEAIEKVIGAPLAMPALSATDATGISAPGQLESHYAPAAQIRLNAAEAAEGELLLAFGEGPIGPEYGLNLSETGDLIEAAANLFGHLRRLDEMASGRRIAVMPIPQHGLGHAINDRLRRAAAPRPD